MRNPWPQPRSHEDLFLERYQMLQAFAARLKDVDPPRAADLVQEAFVQFILCRPPLAHIENMDAYLQRMIRNLQLSEVRRRAPVQSLMLEPAEHETAALQWQALKDRQALTAVQEELCATCHYAVMRKESSRAGSVLILRFFHGYYIYEIAQILRIGKQPVYDLLRMARREARLWREPAERLRFLGDKPAAAPAIFTLPELSAAADLVEKLCDAIFATCQTPCLSAKELRRQYQREADAEPLDTAQAAHIVSCRRCLEVVNRALGLPPLQDRFPTDTLGPGGSSNEERPPVRLKPKARDWQRECRARAEELYHHEPRELLVSVNGFILVRQTINGHLSEQTTSINLAEPISFVEIFCEHGLRLAFFNVEPPSEGLAEQQWQQWQLQLSGARTLDLSLNFERPWPQLHVCYQAPEHCGLRVADCGTSECGLEIAECGLAEARALPSLIFPTDDDAPSGLQGLLASIYSAIRNPQSAIQWLLRPVTITILLTLLLLTVVVGQKLGWWFAPAPPAPKPMNALTRRALPAIPPENPPSVAPTSEPSAGKATASPALTPAAAHIAVTATAALEIEVLRLLNAARADLNEQLEVKRTPRGRLRLTAILDTETRKAELLTALAPLRNHPALEIDLQTVAQAVARQPRGNQPPAASDPVIERAEIAGTTLAVDAELRRYFNERNLSGAALEAELRRFAATARAHSFSARSHATALKQLAARFTPQELRELDATARAQWLGLLRQHARQTHDAALALRAQIAPVFNASGNDGAETTAIKSEEELRRASERLAALCAESDRVMHAALTILTDASPAAALHTPGFWQRLHRIEHLAAALSEVKSFRGAD